MPVYLPMMSRYGGCRPRRRPVHRTSEPLCRAAEAALQHQLDGRACVTASRISWPGDLPDCSGLTVRKPVLAAWSACVGQTPGAEDRQPSSANECAHHGRPLLFGSPADRLGPVALRPRIAPGLPLPFDLCRGTAKEKSNTGLSTSRTLPPSLDTAPHHTIELTARQAALAVVLGDIGVNRQALAVSNQRLRRRRRERSACRGHDRCGPF